MADPSPDTLPPANDQMADPPPDKLPPANNQMADPPTGILLSPAEEYEFRKIKLSREVVDEVTKELKYKFWIIVFAAAVVGSMASVAAYFEVSKYLADAVKAELGTEKRKEIANLLKDNSEFRALVATQTLSSGTQLELGNEVECTLPWKDPKSISQAKCGDDSILLSGGCIMCISFYLI